MRWFISVKSYGDFIIASNALRANGSHSDSLLCGSHLRPLMTAIDYKGNIEWLETGGDNVPAFFDVRKFGILSAIASGVTLHRLINEHVAANDLLVFDRLGWRQNFLAGLKLKAHIATGKTNIYLDYEQFLSKDVNNRVELPVKNVTKIGIFPDSRLAKKQLGPTLVSKIFHDLIKLGCDPQVVYVGSNPTRLGINNSVVNGFDALIDRVRDFDIIISADSLPAHLAEYFEKPVFVISPVNNNYWLPKSAFLNGRFSLFCDVRKCTDWVAHLRR